MLLEFYKNEISASELVVKFFNIPYVVKERYLRNSSSIFY